MALIARQYGPARPRAGWPRHYLYDAGFVALLEAACAGDLDAQDVIYRNHRPALVAHLWRQAMPLDAADLDEVADDAFLAVFARPLRSQEPADCVAAPRPRRIRAFNDAMLQGYLRTVGRRLLWALAHQRRQVDALDLDALAEVGTTTGDDPEYCAITAVRLAQTLKAIDTLGPEQRTVMYMIAEGYSAEQIAKIRGKSSSTVRAQVHQARARLREVVFS